MGELERAINHINKTYGEGTVVRGDQAHSLKLERVSWGSFALDVETGGGVPRGRIVAIHGPFSSGKTSLALKMAAEMQKVDKNKVAWIDAEGAFDIPWAEKMGLDLKRTVLVQPDEGPKGLDIAEELVKTKEISLLVVDSVANIVPTEETEKSMEEWQMGLHARLINKFIRKISMAMNPGNLLERAGPGCTVVLLNQERSTMDKYHPIVTPGGKGKEFAASIIVSLRRGDWISDQPNKPPIGHEIHFKVEKNKTYPPKREGTLDFYFSNGADFGVGDIDNEKSVILYGVEKMFIERAGAVYRYKKESFKGKLELLNYFKSNPKEIVELKAKLIEITPRQTETVIPAGPSRKVRIKRG